VVLARDASDPAGVLALADERLYAEKRGEDRSRSRRSCRSA